MTVLRTIMGVVLLVGVGYFVTNYSSLVKEQAGVKGAHTERAEEITTEIGSDLNQHVDAARDQAMKITVQDVVDFFGRFQKIPEDVTNAQQYVEDQFGNVLKAREEAKEVRDEKL